MVETSLSEENHYSRAAVLLRRQLDTSIARNVDSINGQHDSTTSTHSALQHLGPFDNMVHQAWPNRNSDLTLQTRDQDLHRIAIETMRSAWTALDARRPDLCLERLEKGRSLFCVQGLNLCSFMKEDYGDAAWDGVHFAVELEQSVSADLDSRQDQHHDQAKDDAFKIRHAWRLGWNEDLSFTFQNLSQKAKGGIIVYLLCTCKRCDAVAITSEGTALHIPLHDATPNFARQLARTTKLNNDRYRSQIGPQLSQNRAFKAVAPESDHDKTDEQSMLQAGIGDLWRLIVKPIIDGLGLKSAEGRNRPRITWIPTGPFISIPIHAAGVYEGPSSECCSDYFVSSYAPSILAALRAQAGLRTIPTRDARALLIAEPDAPGMPPLSNATEEVNRVVKLLPPGTRLSPQNQTSSGSCTVSEALSLLPQASFLLLACHGRQDTLDFLTSGFHLSDGRLTAADIMHCEMPYALFAFLSACETAKGDETQADHFLHLSGAMMYAGFKSIIGTMWEMGDVDGPAIATTVYRELFKGDMLDLSVVPYALDEAVQELRRQDISVNRWATFVHIGA